MRAVLSAIALFFAMPAYAQPDVEVEDKPCCDVQRAAAAATPEAAVMAALSDRAFRDGGILWLKLDGGRSLKLIDCIAFACSSGSHAWHQLAAWWPKHRYYVIDVGLYEGRKAYQISERDGYVTELFAPPVLSPSGRYAVLNDWGGYGQGLQLVDLRVIPPAIHKLSGPGCRDREPWHGVRETPVWIDDEHVKFEGRSFPPGNQNAKEFLRITDGNAEWEC
jgi:hypothetical protein